jgi:hypothetical protein
MRAREFMFESPVNEAHNYNALAFIQQHGGSKMRFSQLPVSAQKSVYQYMMVDGEAEDYKTIPYAYAEVPTEALLAWVDDYFAKEHGGTPDGDWSEGPLSYKPSYPKSSVWPVIISDIGFEDGSHRLERYAKIGLKVIPVVAILPRGMTETAPPPQQPPSRRHMLDAIEHADVYGDRKWKLSDFKIEYLGFLDMDELSQYDDFSSWVEVTDPADLSDFRQGDFHYPAGERMPPVIIITAPDPEEDSSAHLSTGKQSGSCMTQVGDGRGRINYAHAHNERLHAYHMIFKGCA